jgi:hypothetical protein
LGYDGRGELPSFANLNQNAPNLGVSPGVALSEL